MRRGCLKLRAACNPLLRPCRTRRHREGDRWVEVTPPGGGSGIALSPGMGEFQPGRETGIALTTSDARSTHEELEQEGVEVEEPMGGDGGVPLLFMLKDMDGNGLMIVQEES